jgi:LysM repeat protein/predicted esterase
MHAVGRLASVVALILSTAVPGTSAQRIHTVANGQTLGAIAKRYGISVTELREANQLPKGVVLKQGQRLLVPSPGEMERLHRHATKSSSAGAEPVSVDELPTDGATPAAPDALASPEPEAPSGDAAAAVPNRADANPSDADVTDGNSTDADVAPRDDAASAPVRNEPAQAPRRATQQRVTTNGATRRAPTEPRYHVVGPGHTLGKIAKRYHLKIESLCGANGLSRHTSLKVGQRLIVPYGDDDPIVTLGPAPSDTASDEPRRRESDPNGMKQLSVSGAGPVYYYEPTGSGRNSMRPIVVYLHGRGGDAEADCRRWSRVARRFGWLLCPSGPSPHNGGRTWNNNWVSGQQAVMGAVQALRNLYGRRVQLYGNTLVGFSEGAYVAMNVGVRQPRTFNRWFILGADVSYWGGAGLEALKDAKSKVRRVVLLTGGRDQVVDDTRTVAGWLDDEGVPLRIQTPGDLAHEVAIERKPELYVSALNWLDKGGPTTKPSAKTKRP